MLCMIPMNLSNNIRDPLIPVRTCHPGNIVNNNFFLVSLPAEGIIQDQWESKQSQDEHDNHQEILLFFLHP